MQEGQVGVVASSTATAGPITTQPTFWVEHESIVAPELFGLVHGCRNEQYVRPLGDSVATQNRISYSCSSSNRYGRVKSEDLITECLQVRKCQNIRV
ncbi:hypothetical protein RRF57_013177 [Xylaria bambusicola]|uniref:Uncharacterized protein n=1 Tax=Xylaria bambusicola TaxID=326684 RepID=A0AAN7ZFC7_9PEZI